jgi:uncharacterized protein YllA (UPF0747 family)
MDAKDGKLEVIGRKELSDRDVRKMLEDSAAHFSPNAVMRPLYQEKILPNVAYIGGAGEISYWMQLKSMFEDFHIDFPVVMVRSSAWVTSTALEKKLKNMNLQIDDLFGDIDELITSYVRKHDDVNLSHEIKELRRIFSSIHEKALGIEESMNRTVEAEKSKAEKALLQLEKKMISRLKAKHEVEINKIRTMHSKLFPLGKPQERVENLFALTMDPRSLIAEMVKVCNPLEHQFYVVESGA